MAAIKWRDALRSRPQALGQPATTERGPPYHPKTCAQNARMFRHKGLHQPVTTFREDH